MNDVIHLPEMRGDDQDEDNDKNLREKTKMGKKLPEILCICSIDD